MFDSSDPQFRRSVRIALLGASLETSNRGVSALTAATCGLFNEHGKSASIVLLVAARNAPARRYLMGSDGPLPVDIVGYSRGPAAGLRNSAFFALFCAALARLSPIRLIRAAIVRRIPLLCAIEQSDAVADLFAGDSFSDIYGIRRLFYQVVPRWCATLSGKPYILLPQTYGPFTSLSARLLAATLVTRASVVFTRTQNDSALLGVPVKRAVSAVYCPDVAFALQADASFRRLAFFGDSPAGQPSITVGLNVNGLLYNGGYNRRNMFNLRLDYREFVHDLVSALFSVDAVKVVLVPHTYSADKLDDVENDLGACLKVISAFPGNEYRCRVVTEDLDQHQIKGVIGGCDVFVGSRLHSCIAALSQGIPTVGVGYSKKFSETFSTLGVEDLVVDARTTNSREAIDRIFYAIEHREYDAQRVKRAVEAHRTVIRETFSRIGGMIGDGTLQTPLANAHFTKPTTKV